MLSLKNRKIVNISGGFFLIWLFGMFIFFIFTRFIRVSHAQIISVVFLNTLLCISMEIFFIVKIDWLRDIKTGKEITCLNISNVLSALRFSLIPILIVMFGIALKGNIFYMGFDEFKIKLYILIFGILIGFTDAFDGFFARKLNESTKLGQILDPLGDFLMITCFTLLIFTQGIIEYWFLAVILLRIPGLFIMMIFYPIFKVPFKVLNSFLGKFTIAYLLVFLCLSLVALLFKGELMDSGSGYIYFLRILQIIGSVLMVISFVDKCRQFYNYMIDFKRSM